MIQKKALHTMKMCRFKTQVHKPLSAGLKQEQIASQTTTHSTTPSTPCSPLSS